MHFMLTVCMLLSKGSYVYFDDRILTKMALELLLDERTHQPDDVFVLTDLPDSTHVVTSPPRASRVHKALYTSEVPLHPRVLIVEESEEMRAYFYQFLSTEYEIVVASCGEEACDLSRRMTVDVVVQDIEFEKEMEAVKLLKKLRLCMANSHISFIAITGYVLPEGKSILRRANYDYYLPKPFTVQRLRGLLRYSFTKESISILNGVQKQSSLVQALPDEKTGISYGLEGIKEWV